MVSLFEDMQMNTYDGDGQFHRFMDYGGEQDAEGKGTFNNPIVVD